MISRRATTHDRLGRRDAVHRATGATAPRRTSHARVEDWESLQPLISTRFNGKVLRRCGVEGRMIPPCLLPTIFSPLTIAQKMTDGQIVDQLRAHPETVHAALKVITEVTKMMVAASYEAGADGIFFASQLTTADVATEAEYREFGVPYDYDVIDASRLARPDGIVFFHAHGDKMCSIRRRVRGRHHDWHDRLTGRRCRRGTDRGKPSLAASRSSRSSTTRPTRSRRGARCGRDD